MTNLRSLEDYNNLKAVKPDHRINYGKHAEQFGDLYLPKSKDTHPTIILIHGGCWQALFGSSQLGQLSKALVSLGFAVWNIEFRRLGNGGGWPTTFEDVAQTVDFLNTIAGKYSLDTTNIKEENN